MTKMMKNTLKMRKTTNKFTLNVPISANCCRICLKSDSLMAGLQDLDKISFSDVPALDVLNEMFRLKIKSSELTSKTLPTKICAKCAKHVAASVELWSLAWDSQWQIEAWKEKLPAEEKSEIEDSDNDEDSGISVSPHERKTKSVQVVKNEGNMPYTCPQCFRRFDLYDALNQHMEVHFRNGNRRKSSRKARKPEKYSTPRHVPRKRRTKQEMNDDTMRQAEAIEANLLGDRNVCTDCGHECRTRFGLNQHKKIHCRSKEFSCGICMRKFKKEGYAKRHIANSHPAAGLVEALIDVQPQNKNVPSDEHDFMDLSGCDDGEIVSWNVQRRVASTPKTPVPKSVGELQEKDKLELMSLFSDVVIDDDDDADTKDVEPVESKPMASIDPYLRHVKKDSMGFFICSICSKRFSTYQSLQYHLKVHLGIRDFECTYCDKAFRCKAFLQMHIRVHTGEKPYACSVCKKTFRVSSSLQSHLRVHSDERPYDCAQCGKSFKTRTALNLHLKIHDEIKPFSCPKCNKAFVQKISLKYHLATHDKEHKNILKVKKEKSDKYEAFSCFHCDKTYQSKSSVVQHMKKHHSEIMIG